MEVWEATEEEKKFEGLGSAAILSGKRNTEKKMGGWRVPSGPGEEKC